MSININPFSRSELKIQFGHTKVVALHLTSTSVVK